jgi:anti-sigma28 factor (negative regulator of flagellin synthesis)
MSSINGLQSALPVHTAVNQTIQRPVAAEPAARSATIDKLELSGVSHLLTSLKSNSDIRTEKVAAVKAQIEAGTYEDDQKLNTAIDRLLDDVT